MDINHCLIYGGGKTSFSANLTQTFLSFNFSHWFHKPQAWFLKFIMQTVSGPTTSNPASLHWNKRNTWFSRVLFSGFNCDSLFHFNKFSNNSLALCSDHAWDLESEILPSQMQGLLNSDSPKEGFSIEIQKGWSMVVMLRGLFPFTDKIKWTPWNFQGGIFFPLPAQGSVSGTFWLRTDTNRSDTPRAIQNGPFQYAYPV